MKKYNTVRTQPVNSMQDSAPVIHSFGRTTKYCLDAAGRDAASHDNTRTSPKQTEGGREHRQCFRDRVAKACPLSYILRGNVCMLPHLPLSPPLSLSLFLSYSMILRGSIYKLPHLPLSPLSLQFMILRGKV